jgi:hypothetical protein
MGNAQSQTDGIAQMLQNGSTYEFICHTMHCSKRKVSQGVKATRDVNYQTGQQIRLTAIKQGAPKSQARLAGMRRSELQICSTSTVTPHS